MCGVGLPFCPGKVSGFNLLKQTERVHLEHVDRCPGAHASDWLSLKSYSVAGWSFSSHKVECTASYYVSVHV